MRSLRFKITAITIIAILTTIMSVFIVSNFTIQKENSRESVEKINLITENTRLSLEQYFESIRHSVEMTAIIATDNLDSVVLVESGAVGSTVNKDDRTEEQIEQLDEYLKDYCKKVEEAFGSIASHTSGVITYYYCINPAISENVHGFFYSRVGKTGFIEQEPLDARTLDPNDIEHTTWYYTPIKRGRPSWVGPYTAHFLNEMWICSYLIPIYKAGELIGVMGMDIPVETLVSQLRTLKVYRTGYVTLLDEDGRVIYHPELEEGSKVELSGMSLDEDLLLKKNNGSELLLYMINGRKKQMSFTTLNNGMKLIVSAPSSEINASWNNLIRGLLVLTAIIIAAYVFVVAVLMRVITRPLHHLTLASKRLAAADYDVALDYRGQDEVGVLTESFSQMRNQLKSYIEDLNRKVLTDELTGTPNMRYFFKLTEDYCRQIIEDGESPAMIFLDLIGMKHYNRQYGFAEGDKLINEVCNILIRHFGEGRVSHFNQDHFAVIAIERGLDEKLKKVFEDCACANSGKSLPLRAGIYLNRLEEVDADTAFDRAKYACDMHRDSYMSGFYYFNGTMLKQAENVRYIINSFDQALRDEWITVHYQPIIRAESGKICDEEALSRWNDPVKGTMTPNDFVPVLENARLAYRLDLYVLDHVIAKMKKQAEADISVVPQSLNLSRADFDSCDIVEEVRRRIDDAGIPHDKLTVEVTESIISEDFEFMKSQILRFQSLGFKVWMDDFGSGYSTIDVLRDIHFDLVKFDMRFMKTFNDGDESRIMLRDLMKMANELGLETVCEGVETAEQATFLKEIGCRKLQGFYFAKAYSYEDSIEVYRQKKLEYESEEECHRYENRNKL